MATFQWSVYWTPPQREGPFIAKSTWHKWDCVIGVCPPQLLGTSAFLKLLAPPLCSAQTGGNWWQRVSTSIYWKMSEDLTLIRIGGLWRSLRPLTFNTQVLQVPVASIVNGPQLVLYGSLQVLQVCIVEGLPSTFTAPLPSIVSNYLYYEDLPVLYNKLTWRVCGQNTPSGVNYLLSEASFEASLL